MRAGGTGIVAGEENDATRWQWVPRPWAATARVDRASPASGARGPLSLRLADDVRRTLIEEKQQTTEKLTYVVLVAGVPADRPNLRLESRKGAYCPNGPGK